MLPDHAARPSAAIERVVHGEAETGLDHRVGRKGIHCGEFEVRRHAAACEDTRVVDVLVGVGLDILLFSAAQKIVITTKSLKNKQDVPSHLRWNILLNFI